MFISDNMRKMIALGKRLAKERLPKEKLPPSKKPTPPATPLPIKK
jgi:hypothetical protein